jgi:very-short-patch-repair endonuclease
MHTRNDLALKGRRREFRRNQTDAEKLLWNRLRKKQFYGLKFFRQYSIGSYVIDFYCSKLALAIELDGGHHNEEQRREYDEARSEYLMAHGINVMRFWNNEVIKNIDGVLERITPPCLPLPQGEDKKIITDIQ